MKINIRPSELRAALIFTSCDDTRFVLNGVKIEVVKGRQPKLIATDGRRLTVIETVEPQDEGLKPCEFIISRDFVKRITAFFSSKVLAISMEYHPSERLICSMAEEFVDSEKGAIIPGKYPNWLQIIPGGEKEPVKKLAVGAEFIADYHKAAKLLEKKGASLVANLFSETMAIEITISELPNFYSILMPCKQTDESGRQPEFISMAVKSAPVVPLA